MIGAWLALSASAWTHAGFAWDDGPIRYCVATDCPLEGCEDLVRAAFDAWLGPLGCGSVWAEPVGPCGADEPVSDGVASVRFAGLEETDVMAYEPEVDGVVSVRGREYGRIVDHDLVLDRAALDEQLVLHGVGHLLGLGHPCEDPDEEPALSVPPCGSGTPPDSVMGGWLDDAPDEPTEDDAAGVRALYDPWLAITCDPAPDVGGGILGAVPLDVRCEAAGDVETTATWAFGDGTTAPTGDHTYDRAGNYEIAVTGACGDGSFAAAETVRVVALAEAPGPPAAPDERRSGCGCRTAGSPAGLGVLGLLALRRVRSG